MLLISKLDSILASDSGLAFSEAAPKHKTVIPKNVQFLVHPAHAATMAGACRGFHPVFLDFGHQGFSG
jgi:hypothetical protein